MAPTTCRNSADDDRAPNPMTDPMSPCSHSDSLQAAATLAVSTGCELDLLDDDLLCNLDIARLSMADISAYIADQWAPLIEILGAADETWDKACEVTHEGADGATTVIATAGAVGIAWTMSARP